MRFTCLLLASLLLPLLAHAADAPDDSKLLGSWKDSKGSAAMQVTFNKDATYTIHAKIFDKPLDHSGTWKRDGKSLNLTCTKSTDADQVGKEHKLTIKELTDEKLLLGGPEKDDEIELVRDKK